MHKFFKESSLQLWSTFPFHSKNMDENFDKGMTTENSGKWSCFGKTRDTSHTRLTPLSTSKITQEQRLHLMHPEYVSGFDFCQFFVGKWRMPIFHIGQFKVKFKLAILTRVNYVLIRQICFPTCSWCVYSTRRHQVNQSVIAYDTFSDKLILVISSPLEAGMCWCI